MLLFPSSRRHMSRWWLQLLPMHFVEQVVVCVCVVLIPNSCFAAGLRLLWGVGCNMLPSFTVRVVVWGWDSNELLRVLICQLLRNWLSLYHRVEWFLWNMTGRNAAKSGWKFSRSLECLFMLAGNALYWSTIQFPQFRIVCTASIHLNCSGTKPTTSNETLRALLDRAKDFESNFRLASANKLIKKQHDVVRRPNSNRRRLAVFARVRAWRFNNIKDLRLFFFSSDRRSATTSKISR